MRILGPHGRGGTDVDGLVMARMVYVSRVPGLPDRYFLAPEGKRFLRENRVFSSVQVPA